MKIKPKKQFETILGFRRIERPSFIESLVFPADTITLLDSEQVSDLHAKYTLLYAYANQAFSETNVAILQLQNQRTERENEIYRSQPGINTLEKWKRDAKMKEDGKIESFNQSLMVANMRRITFEMMLQNFERFIAALSRELSRKHYEKPTGY